MASGIALYIRMKIFFRLYASILVGRISVATRPRICFVQGTAPASSLRPKEDRIQTVAASFGMALNYLRQLSSGYLGSILCPFWPSHRGPTISSGTNEINPKKTFETSLAISINGQGFV